ncbi:thioredoxin-disulfide reductase [Armatimonas sp.]|uniref:thioredoxin-disulfide reductase n=1 Tax=Armatimonas sp. TaxID=1872638 RepID=UPI00374DA68D
MSELRDIVIIGSGPAGLTAAIYAARAELKPLVFEGPQPGGQLTITTEVENYPGFANPIEGPELMDAMREQAERVGTEVRIDWITKVDLSQRPFVIETSSNTTVHAKTLVIATGASAKWIGIESEQRLQNKGVSACATCDGFFFRGKDVAVIGGGDTAMEEAMYLTRMCSSVMVVHRRDTLRASKIMADRALKNPKITFAWDSGVDEILDGGTGKVTGIRLKNLKTNELNERAVQGVFVAIGHQPNTSLFAGQLPMDDAGYLVTDGVKTPIEGCFAAGDVYDTMYRQAVTAAGMGCMAAIEAIRFIEAEESH